MSRTLEHLHVACNNCKMRKVRCNGEQPTCSTCLKQGRECIYQPLRARGRKKGRCLRAEHSQTGLPPLAAKRCREVRLGLGVGHAETGAFQFFGSASVLSFFQVFYRRIHGNEDESLSPGVMRVWGMERFVFPPAHSGFEGGPISSHAWIPRDLADCFVDNYFLVCHPQYPFLKRSDVEHALTASYEPPCTERMAQSGNITCIVSKNILLMVLAIGAITCTTSPQGDPKEAERWAIYLSSLVDSRNFVLASTTIGVVQFLLLKSIFGTQQMRTNDAYLYAGQAALAAIALGMHRAQVADGSQSERHQMRVTFYILYYTERLAALFYGRPSCFRDEFIDVPYPEDLPGSEGSCADTNFAYVRAMADIGKIADQINGQIYFLSGSEAIKKDTIQKCDAGLDEAVQGLPPHLQFFDTAMPISAFSWQDVQRTHIGLMYYNCRILIHRPSVCFLGLHESLNDALAEAAAAGIPDLLSGIDRAVSAANSLILLALDAFTVRAPIMRQDSAVAYTVMGACLCLLYHMLDGPAKTSINDATALFDVVNSGIQVLEYMEHPGPLSGKRTMSENIINVARDAFQTARHSSNNSTEGASSEAVDESQQDYMNTSTAISQNNVVQLDPLLSHFPWLCEPVLPAAFSDTQSLSNFTPEDTPLYLDGNIDDNNTSGFYWTNC
ncbi:hypothetical protein BU24DRAFT_416815 [Aaosphaeria arxii CBS 175.79]|uniref:Zn(2)-C6 fungal-type domain-containing protein n=1 Tax=Aaosphaeria arxii CBS 175.79 TaxID=1450172 RepID=A0A6A5Y785_9PLEO|nr:uncharacterized protein BU24DRAFT_416815 [Aaosphaeria arxii CBS 175.79]KAF2021146.1 hypothetical protein BU24DRAFT_416815 [Aaosphaeria arxii CBS 175.79]